MTAFVLGSLTPWSHCAIELLSYFEFEIAPTQRLHNYCEDDALLEYTGMPVLMIAHRGVEFAVVSNGQALPVFKRTIEDEVTVSGYIASVEGQVSRSLNFP